MKKIIDGVTYNTLTSTLIGRWRGQSDGRDVTTCLYQTHGGAFFSHENTEWAVKREGEWEEREKNEFFPMTREQAQEWMLEGEIEVLDDSVFGLPPEAEAEDEAGATIYLRIPTSLKQRIERAAKKADQSVNVWSMRCLEKCAA